MDRTDILYEPKLLHSSEYYAEIQKQVYASLGITADAQAYLSTNSSVREELDRYWQAWLDANPWFLEKEKQNDQN